MQLTVTTPRHCARLMRVSVRCWLLIKGIAVRVHGVLNTAADQHHANACACVCACAQPHANVCVYVCAASTVLSLAPKDEDAFRCKLAALLQQSEWDKALLLITKSPGTVGSLPWFLTQPPSHKPTSSYDIKLNIVIHSFHAPWTPCTRSPLAAGSTSVRPSSVATGVRSAAAVACCPLQPQQQQAPWRLGAW